MNIKVLQSVLLMLGLSSGVACILLNIYLFNNPGVENAKFLTRISYCLIIFPIPIALMLDKLRSSGRKNDKRQPQ